MIYLKKIKNKYKYNKFKNYKTTMKVPIKNKIKTIILFLVVIIIII